ncbi:hypothetical protein D6833_07970, partial [Candidatus Parcubacteria bacterium]
DAQIQIELWRFLNDPYAREFIDLKPRPKMPPDTTSWDTLRRVAQQDAVTRWLKRFFLQKNYKRVLEFYDGIEKVVGTLPPPLPRTLEHTFSKNERFVWRATAQVYLGRNVREVISDLTKRIKTLETFLSRPMKEKIKDGEFGFRGHPAEVRLRRVIGIAYTTLGYGHTTLGEYRQAAQAYASALRYLRDSGFHTQEAVTRNNLSRVLSELGFVTRGLRICRDALALKEKLGYENPIAYSHSTLALIYNNGLQPENAWREAALAVAYFRKLEERRGLGLALLHLGEALRRLATSTRLQADTPEQLFDTAEAAISEAVQIFDESPESMRRIEVAIEQGCLYRDYMRSLGRNSSDSLNERFRRYKNRALNTLRRAVELAKKKGYPRHQLDAQVDLAWTYYYAGEIENAEKAIEESLALVPDGC